MNEGQIKSLSYNANQLEYILGKMKAFSEYQSEIAGLRDDYTIVSEPYQPYPESIEESASEAVRHLRDICKHLITSAQIHVREINSLITRARQEK